MGAAETLHGLPEQASTRHQIPQRSRTDQRNVQASRARHAEGQFTHTVASKYTLLQAKTRARAMTHELCEQN
jgi:hypothetical protein